MITSLVSGVFSSFSHAFDCRGALASRRHLSEICESCELNPKVRTAVFRALGQVEAVAGFDAVVNRDFAAEVNRVKRTLDRRVIELGAGSAKLTELLAVANSTTSTNTAMRANEGDSYLVSDLFPDIKGWHHLEENGVRLIAEPVNLVSPEKSLGSYVRPGDTLVMSATLHHLRPSEVETLLEFVARRRLSLIALEPLKRTYANIVFGGATGLISLLTSREGWLHPQVPWILSHDGMVSALRQYTRVELARLAQKVNLKFEEKDGLGPLHNFRTLTFTPD